MKEAVIVAACRTAIGRFGGSFAEHGATQLGASVIAEAVRRASVSGEQVDEVLIGNVLSAGLGQNPARQAALLSGLPVTVPATTISKVCGSGLKAIALAAQAIQAEQADVVVAGGMENMSRAPFILDMARFGYRMGNGELIDSLIQDGLRCAIGCHHMGIVAENISEEWSISREASDSFSVESHRKAIRAIQEGRFREEIVPVEIPRRKGAATIVDTDEQPRSDATLEKLANLTSAFKSGGRVTAGNASGICDGAAAVVVMSAGKAAELGVKPIATIRGYASAGVEPRIMGIGPVPATRRALARAGLSLQDIGLVELNEAFAAQSLAVMKDLELDPDKVNVNGGAVALGHPIGASGARILVTLLHQMKRQATRYGLASLCIGGGQGISMIVERNQS